MTKPLSPRDRLKTTLAGQKPDHPPVALWRHFPVDDQSPDTLAAAITGFQNTYNFDFIKVTPESSYANKDWGTQDVWKGNTEGTREPTQLVIHRPEDWENLKILDPRKGHLGKQLDCLKLVSSEFSSRFPIIPTIFSPLSLAKHLVGKQNLISALRTSPQAVHSGLRVITRTMIDFVQECKPLGIEGIFYAVQHASYNLLSAEEFAEFGKFYDLQVLDTVRDLWLNVGHIHGENIMFDLVSDYPVQVLNWHDRHTQPGLQEALSRFEGVVCGGLRQWETLVLGDPTAITLETRDAIQQTGGKRFILGTGCVVPIIAPSGNLWAARRAVETFQV